MTSRFANRADDAMRPLAITRGYTRFAPGSVLVAYGETRVLVTATVEERVPRHIKEQKSDGHGWLTAEYAMLPGATLTRNQRDRFKISGRTQEIQRIIGRSLRACVDLSKLGQRTITIDADVLQADGGTRVAAITGGYVALADALADLRSHGLLAASPLRFAIAALSVGVVDGRVLLDLDYEEDSRAEVDSNLVMNDRGEFIEMQATSEHAPFARATLDDMLRVAEGGFAALFALQREALLGAASTDPAPALAV